MEITIRELAAFVKWPEVKRAIKFHYPKDKNDYQPLYTRLGTMRRQKTKAGQFLEVYGGFDPDNEWSAKLLEDLKKGDESNYYGIHMKVQGEETNYSISFMKWNYLANMPIHHDTLRHYTFVDILAHFIWEITYYGNEKQTKKHAKEIFSRVKDVQKQLKAESSKIES